MKPFDSSFISNYLSEIVPPKITVQSPINQTYHETNVTLDFAVDKQFNWVGYSLDGQANITLTGNSTLTNLTYGQHSVTLYANSTFGVLGSYGLIGFTVVQPEAPFPNVIAIAVIAITLLVIGTVAGFMYYRRHQRKVNFRF